MATQIERKRESLKKLELQQDLKRLKMAKEHLDSALEILNEGFHEQKFSEVANEIFGKIDSPLADIEAILSGKTDSGESNTNPPSA